jgi:sugar lactone lactonase YvrE
MRQIAAGAWKATLVLMALGGLLGKAKAEPPLFPGATPTYKSWTVARLPGAPEGLTQDSSGRLYAAVSTTGEIVRLEAEGKYTRVATVPSRELAKVGRTWGIAFGPDGDLYAAYVWHYSEAEEMDAFHLGCRNSKDQYTGVYRVNTKTGTVTPWVTKHDGWSLCFPDDVAVDSAGNVYVTDETLSGIWKITPDRTFSLWSSHALLQWPPEPFGSLPQGANDLAIAPDGRSIYVVTEGAPMLLRIGINTDGSAAAPVIIARDMSPLDGVALDESGNIFVSEVLRNEIWLYSPDGESRVLVASADTAPLVNPTSLVYRDGVLCTANLGWHIVPDPRTIVCISGFHRPKAPAPAH